MAVYQCQGIILRRHNFGEADRILAILTNRFGKVTALGKAVRRPLSKLAGHLEPFCHSQLLLAEGKNFEIVAEAQTLHSFPHLRDSLKLTSVAYYLGEILDKITRDREENFPLFQLFLSTLQRLDQGKDGLLKSYFEINLLALSGFKPELQSCLSCHQKLSSSSSNFFSPRLGGILNQACQREDSSAFLISQDAIKLLRFLLGYKIQILDKLKVKDEIAKEVDKVLQSFLSFVLEREIKSIKFLKEVAQFKL